LERDEESERMREEEKGLCTNRYKRQGASLTDTLLCPKAPARVVPFGSYGVIVLGALLCTWGVRIDATLTPVQKMFAEGSIYKNVFSKVKIKNYTQILL
jgi:hypothetical protein